MTATERAIAEIAALTAERDALQARLANMAQVREAAQSILSAYDRETFMRSADFHQDTCECSRCGFDRLRAALAALEHQP